jgi:hypothetical protein
MVSVMKLYVFPSDEGVVFEDLAQKTAPHSDFLNSRTIQTAAIRLMWAIGIGLALFALFAG